MSHIAYTFAVCLVYSLIFLMSQGLIVVTALYRSQPKRLFCYKIAIIILVQVVLMNGVNALGWIDIPDGRYFMVAMTTYLYGPLTGLVVSLSNIFISYVTDYNDTAFLIANTFMNYGVFLIAKIVYEKYQRRFNVYVILLAAFIVLILFEGLVIKNFVTSHAAALERYVGSYILISILMRLSASCLITFSKRRELDFFNTIGTLRMAQHVLEEQNSEIVTLNNKLIESDEELLAINDDLERQVVLRTEELEQKNQALQKEIEKEKLYEKSLLKAREEAEEANRAKSEFLANMSHEIRTPINAIMGFHYLLNGSGLNDRQNEYVRRANQSSEHLLEIINDILDFSKLEADQMPVTLEKESLYEIIDATYEAMVLGLQEKRISYKVDVGKEVEEFWCLDAKKIRQIMLNLLANAVKFTPNDGEISMKVRLRPTSDKKIKTLLIEISDTGIGISEQDQKLLFTAFTQVQSQRNRMYGGTGLGLSICKKLVDLMGGSIHVASQPGKGATFLVKLLLEPAQIDISDLYEFKPQKILIVQVNETGVPEYRLLKSLKNLGQDLVISRVPDLIGGHLDPLRFSRVIITCHSIKDIELGPLLKVLSKVQYVVPIHLYSNQRYMEVDGIKNVLFDRVFFDPTPIKTWYHLLSNSDSNNERECDEYYRYNQVLVVEDNSINQLVIREILEGKGLKTTLVSNGEEAVQTLKMNRYDLVLMDIHMPVMDGLEATKLIREDLGLKELPIVALTADVISGVDEAYSAHGLTDYITKPINITKLERVLNDYLYHQTQDVADLLGQ